MNYRIMLFDENELDKVEDGGLIKYIRTNGYNVKTNNFEEQVQKYIEKEMNDVKIKVGEEIRKMLLVCNNNSSGLLLTYEIKLKVSCSFEGQPIAISYKEKIYDE